MDLPTQSHQLIRHLTYERCVTFIQQSIDLTAAPRNDSIEAGIDCGERPAKDPDRQRREVPSFDQGDRLLRQPRGPGDVRLTQSSTMTKRHEQPPDPNIIHRWIVPLTACLRLMRPPYLGSCLAA